MDRIGCVHVDPADIPAFRGATGRDRIERPTGEERQFDVPGEDVERCEPALPGDTIKRRIPPHRFLHTGHGTADDVVELSANGLCPIGHRGDVRLHGSVTIPLRDLRIAPREPFSGWSCTHL